MAKKVIKYYLFHKPYQVQSQFSPIENKQTLSDYLQVEKDVYPVGRLDYDSEGLLLLTNDKSINSAILSPEKHISKTYWVQVEGEIKNDDIAKLKDGVDISIKGKSFLVKALNIIKLTDEITQIPERNPPIRYRKNIPTSWVEIIIDEGKNRQVRRMFAKISYPVLRLIRVSLGKLDIGNLLNSPGKFIILSQNTINRNLK